MRPGERLLRGGLEAWIGLLEAVGARGIRWEWKKNAWRQALDRRLAGWENLERGVRAPVRMCPGCRALVDRSLGACPECGTSLRGVPGGGPGRLLRLFLPGIGSVSTLLLTINIGMSLVALAAGGIAEGRGGLLGLLSPPPATLFALGSKSTGAILAGESWRLVTATYLHGGLLHLMFNCYALMILGPLIENSFGARRFFLLYSLAGIAGFTLSALVRPYGQSVGASGALFGLLGFGIVFGKFRGGASGRMIANQLLRNLIFMGIFFLIPGIDNAAHIGGLAAGAALALLFDTGPPRTRGNDLALNLLTAATVLLTLGSFAAMLLSYGANMRLLQG